MRAKLLMLFCMAWIPAQAATLIVNEGGDYVGDLSDQTGIAGISLQILASAT